MEKVIPETTASQFRVEPLCYVMHRHSAMLLVKVVVVWSFEVCFLLFFFMFVYTYLWVFHDCNSCHIMSYFVCI